MKNKRKFSCDGMLNCGGNLSCDGGACTDCPCKKNKQMPVRERMYMTLLAIKDTVLMG
jgi:hypothetical protein